MTDASASAGDPHAARLAGSSFTIAVVTAVVLGTALRLQGLGRECFWFDELLLDRTSDGIGSFLYEQWRTVEPPLYHLVMWPWHSLLLRLGLEHDEAAVRAPIVAMGVAAIPFVAAAARGSFGVAAGMLAAALVATNPYQVRYSQEARMYALTFLLMSASVLYLVRALRDGRPRDALLCGLCGAAASYAHFYSLLAFGAMCAATVIAWMRSRDPRFAVLLRGEAIGLALVVPYVATEAWQLLTTGQGKREWLALAGTPGLATLANAGEVYATHVLHAVVPAFVPGSLDAVVTRAAPIALGALVLIGALARRDDEPPYLRSHLLWIAVAPFAIVFALSQAQPIFHPRYLIAAVAALFLLAVRARPVWLVVAIAAPALAVGAVVAPRYHHAIAKPDYRGAAAALAATIEPGAVVAVHPLDRLPLKHYARRLPEGAGSALVDALSAKNRPHVRVRRTLYLQHTPKAPRDGAFYEIDVEFPRTSIRESGVASRLAPRKHLFHGYTLIFADAPIPYLRVWRRNSDGNSAPPAGQPAPPKAR